MKEEIEEIILNPDPIRVMEGLRDTGYDFNTAIADIVDNSIAANATKINITAEIDPSGEINIYIADNGDGMDLNGLKNAMRYGSAQRDNPCSLGKFGLGLKTASTAFCRELSLVSKTKDSEYRKVQWDLDEIAKVNKWKLGTPSVESDEIELLEEVSQGISGTLVVWHKIDRLMKKYSNKATMDKAFQKLLDGLAFHIGCIFQRFIDKQNKNVKTVQIKINGVEVKSWDPFYVKESEIVGEETINVEMPDKTTATFKVTAYLLPRSTEFSSPEAEKNARISNDMQGFYVYRENRLIHFGDWLGMFTNEPHASLLRIDFSFDHTLDDAFNVDIKKSRITLYNEIYLYLKENFLPAPRRAAHDRYRKGKQQNSQTAGKNAHDASNASINEKASKLQNSKVEVIDKATGKAKISNKQGDFVGIITVKNEEKPGQCRVIPVSSITSNMLWEPTIVDGKHAVSINQSHKYYEKVYVPIIENKVLITGMDSLLWALSEAELSTYNNDTKEQYEDMRVQVSRILNKLVNDLPDPDFELKE